MIESASTIIFVVVALLSLAITAFLAWYTIVSRRRFGRKETIQNIQEMLIGRYSERRLTSSFKDDEREYSTFREIRATINEKYDLCSEKPLELLMRFHKESVQKGTIENKFAYEASLAIQEIGIMLLSGYIPIEVIVSSNGYQFIEDWLYSYQLIEELIRNKYTLSKKTKDNSMLKYHRIHGEWLAHFSYLYFEKHWTGSLLKVFSEYFASKQINSKERKVVIRMAETQIIPKHIKKKIDSLI